MYSYLRALCHYLNHNPTFKVGTCFHELFSHRNGSELTKPMVCRLQALDAAFNHDVEQQQKSSKAGNRHNGFWAKETGLTNTWSETDGQCARMYKSCCRILEASTILIFFSPLVLIAAGGAGACYLQPQNLDLCHPLFVIEWIVRLAAGCCRRLVHGGHGYSR